MYDLPSVKDYGKAVETSERKLRTAIAKRDAAMTVIEASRRGPNFPTNIYIAFKIIHGNAEGDAHRYEHYLRSFGFKYMAEEMEGWAREHHEMKIARPSRVNVWRHWHNMVAACKASDALKPEVTTDRWGCDKIIIVSREMIDAEVAAERAKDLYDRVLRAYEGRQPPTWEMMLDGRRTKLPSSPEPTPLNKIQNRRRKFARRQAAFAD